MLDENGFDMAPNWVYIFANILLALLLFLITIYVLLYYSHTDEKFNKYLTNMNAAGTFVALLFHIIILYWPSFCAFYLIEVIFFNCEFNLFQFRTALFYQSDRKYYNRLYHMLLALNILNTYHNVIALATGFRMAPLTYGCRSTIQLKTLTVAVPVFAIKTYFLYLGFYTVRKFWYESGDEARRKMKILWLVLLCYGCDYLTAMFLMIYTGTDGPDLYFREVIVIFDKALSLLLAFIIYLRVLEREAVKAALKATVKSSQTVSEDNKPKCKIGAGSVQSAIKGPRESIVGFLPNTNQL